MDVSSSLDSPSKECCHIQKVQPCFDAAHLPQAHKFAEHAVPPLSLLPIHQFSEPNKLESYSTLLCCTFPVNFIASGDGLSRLI